MCRSVFNRLLVVHSLEKERPAGHQNVISREITFQEVLQCAGDRRIVLRRMRTKLRDFVKKQRGSLKFINFWECNENSVDEIFGNIYSKYFIRLKCTY